MISNISSELWINKVWGTSPRNVFVITGSGGILHYGQSIAVNPPDITSQPSCEGTKISISATFFASRIDDGPFTSQVDYGVGDGFQNGTVSGNIALGPNHVYADSGSYAITIKVIDKYGVFGSSSAILAINNVPSPEILLDKMLVLLEQMDLPLGILNGLENKLQNARDSIAGSNSGQREDAVNKIQAFINSCEAQLGKALTSEQAQALISQADDVILTLLN